VSSLYTKEGVPLTIRGDRVFNDRGENFGYLSGDRVFGLDGGYRGTVVDGRLVYRSTQAATIGTTRAQHASTPGSASAHAAGSAMLGDEPDIGV
jgi:hypothetical protein